jgi:hypothetical protein
LQPNAAAQPRLEAEARYERTLYGVGCSGLLGDSSWSRYNCSIARPDKPDKVVTAMLLHLDGPLVLEPFSDFEEACIIGGFDARTDFIFRLPDAPSAA